MASDRLIQGMTGNGDFRVIAAETTEAARTVRRRADLSPVAAVALGRLITGAVLLARLLDKSIEGEQITLRVDGDGPLGLMIAEANTSGFVRGYVANGRLDDPEMNVGAAVGEGHLTVVRTSVSSGRPYTSQVDLQNGEIATDISHYLATSEQILSGVLLGVSVSSDGVDASGGMIVQKFPHVVEVDAAVMEATLDEAPPFSSLLTKMPLDDVVSEILRGVGYKPLASDHDVPIEFRCACTRERALAPYGLLEQEEIEEMIEKDAGSESICQFCGERYHFTAEDLRSVTARMGQS